MSPPQSQSTAENPGGRFDSWVLRILTQPPVSRATRVVIVAVYVGVIGVIDYASGTSISLQVFYLAPIALALAWLGFFAAFVASVCSIIVRVGGDYLLEAEYTRRPSIIWNVLGFLATYMIVAWILRAFITLRRELEERIHSRTAALEREVTAREHLQHELTEISERERRTIGNDLHDGLGQHLTAMAFAAEVLTQQLDRQDPLAAGTAREIGRLAGEGIAYSRQLARGLLLTAIEPASLTRELEELAAALERQTGVRCHFESRSAPLVGDSSTASQIFHIAQEGLRNSLRHAAPTMVNLSLHGEKSALVLAISDNGPGPAVPGGGDAALREIEHRARLIGAEFTREINPGQGTRLCCRVPLASSPLAS